MGEMEMRYLRYWRWVVMGLRLGGRDGMGRDGWGMDGWLFAAVGARGEGLFVWEGRWWVVVCVWDGDEGRER